MDVDRHWDLNDAAKYIGVSRRSLDDMTREPGNPMPPPFGTLGRSRIWHAASVRAAKKDILAFLAGGANRSIARREAELQQQKMAHERRVAAFEAEMARGREQREMFQQAADDHKRIAEGGKPRDLGAVSPMFGGSK